MRYAIIIIILFVVPFNFAQANNLPDADRDGVPDYDEVNVYFTEMNDSDTDNDGFGDWQELNSGFSPHNPKPVKLENNDADADGLNDRMEIKYGTNLVKSDTDGDRINDGEEINRGYDPLVAAAAVVAKNITINTARQELSYYSGTVRLGTFRISSGMKSMPTPKGVFKVGNKSKKAWSKTYGLWMPYWLGMEGQRFGIHELPIWPNGYREGENHLGIAVSHGCVRLGIGAAKTLFDWAEVGTKVIIN